MVEPQAESYAAGAQRDWTALSPERAESTIPTAESNGLAARKRRRQAAQKQIQEEEKRIQEKEREISRLQKEISEIQKDRELFAKLKRLRTLNEEDTKTLRALRNELWSLRDGARDNAIHDGEKPARTHITRTISRKRGERSEHYARKILKGHIRENPLAHTTLNYFESFLTQDMISELAKVLDADIPARSNLGRPREMWGGLLRDYFAQREEYNQERSTRTSFSWNTYSHQGYLLKQRGV
ncbi:hypothetical protein B0J12DRAFT_742155 [Macrophomina phaseolina]|uniref:Uncharacterized protein n=1 Tax=Macrophomina phaseolina TaxID=35725 RepID=A0ABQ8G592_9PEZI|nr:hypothetical protein B0J12DRAFT_742155 [Macrophomina phaseolina]